MVRLMLLLLLICCTSVYASLDIGLLKSLLDSGQTEKAYDYATKEVLNHEGDPEFDYYYGIAAIDSGHASEGVFALERVQSLDPNNHAARLELARGYFVLEEYSRARQKFETVLSVDPPQDVVDKVNIYLDAISSQEGRYKTTQVAFVEFGLGSDSNANSGPDITSFNIGTLTIPLDTNSQAKNDNFTAFESMYLLIACFCAR
jgi:tetratricopeptide (TPR) repeat protein